MRGRPNVIDRGAVLLDDGARPPALFIPYPLDEYLDALPGDYSKVARCLLRAARWRAGPTPCGRYVLDAGETLMDERSDMFAKLKLDRDVSPDGRRALVRRVLDRLERDGVAARRSAAQAIGPASSPRTGPRNGPTPTVVRFLKFRHILWPASSVAAQGTAQEAAHDPAQESGPIQPASPPGPPDPSRSQAGAREERDPELGPLTVDFRSRVEAGLGRGLSIAASGNKARVADELERVLDLVGVEEAFSFVASTCRAKQTEPGSLNWFLTVLRPKAAAVATERAA